MKKSYFYIIIIVIILAILAGFYITNRISKNSNGGTSLIQKSYKYSDTNKTITVTGNKECDFEQNTDNPDYLIDLSNKDGFKMLVSTVAGVESKPLNTIANADQEVYTAEYEGATDFSEVTSGKIADYDSYSYSFKYPDTTSGKDVHMQIHFLRINDITYVIDFIYPGEEETTQVVETSDSTNIIENTTTSIETVIPNKYEEQITFLLSNIKFNIEQTETSEPTELTELTENQ